MVVVYIMLKPVLEINTDQTNLGGEKIPEWHMYHSKPFRDTFMLLQRYCNIGNGVIQLYVNVRFTCSNNVILPFTSTSEVSFQPPHTKELIGLCVHCYFAQNMAVDKYSKTL